MPQPHPGDLSALDTSAVALHELYLSLQQGGFTRDEALSLCGFVLIGKQDALGMVRGLLDGGPHPPDPTAPEH